MKNEEKRNPNKQRDKQKGSGEQQKENKTYQDTTTLLQEATSWRSGCVKIQNRGPEQEIPAVTCVRLIAQKHRY